MKIEEEVMTKWSSLFKISGVFSWIVALLLIAEIFVFSIFPSITDPKALLIDFANNWFIGLLRFDLIGMIAYLFLIPVTLSLYYITKSANYSLSIIATCLFFVGITMFYSTNTGFSVLSLSKQFVTATSEDEKNIILSSCLSMITLFKVNSFMLSYIVVSVSWCIISIAMHKSKKFKKFTTISGILAGSSGIIAEIFENVSVYLKWPAILLYFAAIVFLIFWIIGIGTLFSNENYRRKVKGKMTDI